MAAPLARRWPACRCQLGPRQKWRRCSGSPSPAAAFPYTPTGHFYTTGGIQAGWLGTRAEGMCTYSAQILRANAAASGSVLPWSRDRLPADGYISIKWAKAPGWRALSRGIPAVPYPREPHTPETLMSGDSHAAETLSPRQPHPPAGKLRGRARCPAGLCRGGRPGRSGASESALRAAASRG
jgi:hypothetical protein